MFFKYIFKYFRDLIRLGFKTDGNFKFGKLIFKKIKKGIYLDVGCYHPIKESQTAFLYNRGWKGVNLDISKQSIEMFKIFRSRDLNLNLGLSTKSGKQYAYFEGDISTVSSLDKNYLKGINIRGDKVSRG